MNIMISHLFRSLNVSTVVAAGLPTTLLQVLKLSYDFQIRVIHPARTASSVTEYA